jgi:preprotein translocase subunit SecF
VNIPKSVTTVTTTVGGQPVNVTVYWQPNYVELTGSALIIPPSTSAHMTLQVEQQNYVLEPDTIQTGVAVSNAATASSGASSTPQTSGNSTTPTQIPAFGAQAESNTTISSTSSGSLISPLSAALIAVIVIILAIVGVVAFRFKKK